VEIKRWSLIGRFNYVFEVDMPVHPWSIMAPPGCLRWLIFGHVLWVPNMRHSGSHQNFVWYNFVEICS
jgi:hypothetical protein